MHKDLFVRVCWVAAVLLLAAPLLLRLYVVFEAPPSHWSNVVDFFYDDGYYYLTIAANLAELGRSTFDGLTATNGYQPLWLLVLAGLAKLVGTEPQTLFTAACVLMYGIACAAPLLALLWWKSPSRYVVLCFAAGLAVVEMQQPMIFVQGLEPILIAPLAVPLVLLLERAGLERSTLLQLSAVLAAAFLVRLDALALFATASLCLPLFELLAGRLSLREIAPRALGSTLTLVSFVVPTVIVYLAINHWLFGSPVPVSGLAKLIGAPKFSNWGAMDAFIGRWHSAVLLLVIMLPLEFLTRWSGSRPTAIYYRSMTVITAALVIQSLYYAAFSAWYLWPWYTYLVAIDMALLIARIVYLAWVLYANASAWQMRLVAVAASLLLGVWVADRSLALAASSLPPRAVATSGPPPPVEKASSNQVSLKMLDSFFATRARTVIAMGDRAGGLSFWGRGNVAIFQTEGLTFNIEYLQARVANQAEQFLENLPIQYFVIDREVIPKVVGADGRTQFVIAEPIQGRINSSPVPTFCFPLEAVQYEYAYQSVYGVNTRMAFDFAVREPCSQEALTLIGSVERGVGLRQFSLPGEYDPREGGMMNKAAEDRDRLYAKSSSTTRQP